MMDRTTTTTTIAFVTSTPTCVRDGSGTHVGIAVLREALEGLGYCVPLVTLAPGPRPLGHTVQRVLFNARVGRRLAALRPDLVVGFDLDGFALTRRQAPVHVAAIKGVIADELTYEDWAVRMSLGVQALCERRHVARVPLVITTSTFARGRLATHYGLPLERIRVVPEPIDLARWDLLLGQAPRRLPGSAAPVDPSAAFTVLCVAHMYPRKSLGTLITAMARLRLTHPQARLRMVGHGPEEARLRRLATRLQLDDVVTFLGHVPLAALAAEYAAADAFCLPSRQEGFGIVFLEAMAAGLPVVACRAAAVPEVVGDGETGLLVPPLDAGALAAALARLADDALFRRRLGAAGRRRAGLYTPESVATAFLSVLREQGVLADGPENIVAEPQWTRMAEREGPQPGEQLSARRVRKTAGGRISCFGHNLAAPGSPSWVASQTCGCCAASTRDTSNNANTPRHNP